MNNEKRQLKISEVQKRIPKLYQACYLKAASGKASPREAIKAFCQSCVGYSNVADEIANCPDLSCSLFCYRPFKILPDASGKGLKGKTQGDFPP
jgi:hypothetical protein